MATPVSDRSGEWQQQALCGWRDKHDVERLDEACGIGVGSAGRVSGAMDTVRYEPCPSRNGSGCSTAGHKTKASSGCGTPWRGWE